jgi:hypothetical protein
VERPLGRKIANGCFGSRAIDPEVRSQSSSLQKTAAQTPDQSGLSTTIPSALLPTSFPSHEPPQVQRHRPAHAALGISDRLLEPIRVREKMASSTICVETPCPCCKSTS